MAIRCPLCRAGPLTLAKRDLSYDGKLLATEIHFCSACRESLLDASQIAALRAAIVREGFAATDAEVDQVVERVMLQAS